MDLELIKLRNAAKRAAKSNVTGDSDSANARLIDDLQSELESVRNLHEDQLNQCEKFKTDIADLKAYLTQSQSDKTNLTKDLEKIKKENAILQEKVLEADKERKTAELKKKESNRETSDYFRENKKLLEEKQDLEESNSILSQQLKSAEARCTEIELIIVRFHDENEALSTKLDNSNQKIAELQEQLDTAHVRIEQLDTNIASGANQKLDFEKILIEAKQASLSDLEKAKNELKTAKEKNILFEKQINDLKNSTLVGEKQKQIDILSTKESDAIILIAALKEELENAVSDKKILADRIAIDESKIDQRVAEKTLAVKERLKMVEKQLEETKQNYAEEAERFHGAEKEKDELLREIDDLKRWRDVYEKNLSIQVLAKEQRKLLEDKRRLGVVIDQMKVQLDTTKDSANMYLQAFTKLKSECGKPADFMYPEFDLQEEVSGENAKLNAIVSNLEEQILSLEKENSDLRKTIRKNAGSIGEQGFKYANMSPEQLIQVNEFASNLRDGKLVLPENNRSRELLDDNKKLREKNQSLQLLVERFEREVGGVGYNNNNNNSNNTENNNMITAMREDMHRLMNENSELQQQLIKMQGEITQVIKQHASSRDSKKTSYANENVVENELFRELHDLKASLANIVGSQQVQAGQVRQIQDGQGKSAASGSNKGMSVSTPAKGVQFSTSYSQPSTPHVITSFSPMYGGFNQPTTPGGKQLLNKNISQLNLPPEEWVQDYKELNGQLIECLEQLYEREEEINGQRSIITNLEETLTTIKQQMAALYHDYAHKADAWDSREKQYKTHTTRLIEERDNLKLKVQRFDDMLNQLKKEDSASIETKCAELNRKVTIYEVNEAVLSRKFVAQQEQIQGDLELRQQLEYDFAEMESILKKRILYLEQFKLSASARIGYLQGKLDTSVPQEDFFEINKELDCLREDHLNALRREVEARVAVLKVQDQGREIKSLRLTLANVNGDLAGCKSAIQNLSSQLEHEKELSKRAASTDTAVLVSEMAKFRGEAGRLEVELNASNAKVINLNEEMKALIEDAHVNSLRISEIEKRDEEYSKNEEKARKDLLEMKIMYENGLTRNNADELRQTLDKITVEVETCKQDVVKYKEMAEIASQQAQSMQGFKDQYEEEIKALREHSIRLESRSDDDVLIGKLQRQLMSTKTSYKAFVRKHEHLRSNMRKRELALRVLETRLDQREKEIIEIKDKYQIEILALKKALRNVNNLVDADNDSNGSAESKSNEIKTDSKKNSVESKAIEMALKGPISMNEKGLLTIGHKLSSMSSKVSYLSTLAEKAVVKATEADEESRKLQGTLEDVQIERDNLLQRLQSIEAVLNGNNKMVTARLVSLSEEVRINKLNCMQQRRQIQVLKQEKRHLQGIITGMEADVEGLEEGKVLLETKNLLGDISDVKDTRQEKRVNDKPFTNFLALTDADIIKLENIENVVSNGSKTSHRVSFIGNELPNDRDVDALLEKLSVANEQLSQAKRDANVFMIRNEGLISQVTELQTLLQERTSQLQHLEKSSVGYNNINSNVRSSNSKLSVRDDTEKLQEAANAKISSLLSLLEERNRTIDKLRLKVDTLSQSDSGKKHKSAADKKAELLLEKLGNENANPAKSGKSNKISFDDFEHSAGLQSKLSEQLHQSEELLVDKDKIIQGLEQKLLVHINHKERAEQRCGAALQEMEAMKNDMLTLAKQLQQSEERLHLMSRTATSKLPVVPGIIKDIDNKNVGNDDELVVGKLRRALKTKDEKLKGYREIIVKLKEEFIKSEEEKAISMITMKGPKVDNPNSSTVGAEEMKELRHQISALRDGLKQAKDDLDKARKTREKLIQARQAAQEESSKFEAQLSVAESQAQAAQESLARVRKELEESNRKNQQLRDKVKDLIDHDKNQQKSANNQDNKSQIEQFEKEIELLRAQNFALRKASENRALNDVTSVSAHDSEQNRSHDDSKSRITFNKSATAASSMIHTAATGTNTSAQIDAFSGKGHVVGESNIDRDDLKSQLHAKWETEKKLQKRVTILEKRLQERIEETEDLQLQLRKARDTAQSAVTLKEEEKKKTAIIMKQTQDTKKLTAGDIDQLNAANGKIYSLEELVANLRRKCDVEQASEIASLRHQVAASKAREEQYKTELEESEGLRKKQAGGGRTLRDSEDRFMREERLKDELSKSRQIRYELEAAILDRDARAMEIKFDLEARDQEIERLKRRNKELETAYKSMSSMAEHNAGMSNMPKSAWTENSSGGGNKDREKDLEGVVDAMKRVVDKLKAENDRLRKGTGTEDKKASEFEKKAAMEKKKADKLEEDMKVLLSRLKVHEDNAQKNLGKQSEISSVRKKLKAKEDELANLRAQAEEVEEEKDNLFKKLQQTEQRISQLEISLQNTSVQKGKNVANATTDQKEVDSLKKKMSEQALLVENLKREIVEAKSVARQQASEAPGSVSNFNVAEFKQLKEENEKLRDELSAFDMNFFEEIENLKYAHAEAIRKLKVYEKLDQEKGRR